jgi:hypothetical protein
LGSRKGVTNLKVGQASGQHRYLVHQVVERVGLTAVDIWTLMGYRTGVKK